jgi:hypothetical protein
MCLHTHAPASLPPAFTPLTLRDRSLNPYLCSRTLPTALAIASSRVLARLLSSSLPTRPGQVRRDESGELCRGHGLILTECVVIAGRVLHRALHRRAEHAKNLRVHRHLLLRDRGSGTGGDMRGRDGRMVSEVQLRARLLLRTRQAMLRALLRLRGRRGGGSGGGGGFGWRCFSGIRSRCIRRWWRWCGFCCSVCLNRMESAAAHDLRDRRPSAGDGGVRCARCMVPQCMDDSGTAAGTRSQHCDDGTAGYDAPATDRTEAEPKPTREKRSRRNLCRQYTSDTGKCLGGRKTSACSYLSRSYSRCVFDNSRYFDTFQQRQSDSMSLQNCLSYVTTLNRVHCVVPVLLPLFSRAFPVSSFVHACSRLGSFWAAVSRVPLPHQRIDQVTR